MAHHRSSHLKTEQEYRLRLAQLEQAITALKSQIAQETALIQDFKSPANIFLALAVVHHRRQGLGEIAQARQRLIRLERELAELQAEEQMLTQEWERRKDQLRQAAELAAKEEAQRQNFKRVRLDEQQLVLEDRQAALEKKQAKKRLLKEEKRLQEEIARLNKQLVEVRRLQRDEDESK